MSFWELNSSFSDNIAIIDETLPDPVTYRVLFEDVDTLVENIKSDRKQLILILTENSYTSVVSYLAALKSNAAVMLMDSQLDIISFNNIINDYSPDIIISSGGVLANLDNTSILKSPLGDYYITRYNQLNNEKIYSDLALLLSTSGSTGSSKFVRLTKKNILSNTGSIIEYLGIDKYQTAITTLPLHYSFGLSIVNTHLMAGAKILITRKAVVQKEFWDLFKKYEVATFSGVPYTFQILEKIRFSRMDLPSLQYFTQAGGHLNVQTKKYFLDYANDKGKKFVVMYGQTEATARISYVPFESLEHKLESIGIAIPKGKLLIQEDDIIVNEPDKTGEILYSGDNVMLGYAENRGSLTSGDELNGVLKTGDVGKFDADGYFYVVGRLKRFLKVFGNRVNMDDLERLLEVEFKVPFAVTGEDDRVCILMERNLLSPAVLEYTSKKLGIHFSAFKLISVDSLPLSPNGKKDYQKVKEIFYDSEYHI